MIVNKQTILKLGTNLIRKLYKGVELIYNYVADIYYLTIDGKIPYFRQVDGTMIITNQGNFDNLNDGLLYSGRAVELGATNDLPIPIHHTLGAETIDIGTTINMGDEVAVYTYNSASSFDLAVTTVGTNVNRPALRLNTATTTAGRWVLAFNAVVVSGTPILRAFTDGSGIVPIDKEIVNGYNEFNFTYAVNKVNSFIYFKGTELFSIEIDGMSFKQITSMANSFLTYYDLDTNEVIQLDNSLNTSSTTYTFNDVTLNNILTHKMPFSAGDLTLIQQEPNLLASFAMGEATPISSVTLDADDSWYACSEVSGAYVVDQRAGYGVEEVTNGKFDIDIIGWSANGTGTTLAWNNGKVDVVGTTASFAGIRQPKAYQPGIYVMSVEITNYTKVLAIQLWNGNGTVLEITENGTYSFLTKITTEASGVQVLSNNQTNNTFTADNISVKKATASEIANYMSTIRTNADQLNIGLQTTCLELDGAGVPTAYTDTEIMVYDDTLIDTQWTPDVEEYSIEETVTGELQDFGVDLLGTTAPSLNNVAGGATIDPAFTSNTDNDFSFGVSVTGTSSQYPFVGTTATSSYQIGATYQLSFDVVVNSGTPILQLIRIGSDSGILAETLKTGPYSFEVTTATSSNLTRMNFDGRNTFDIEVTNWQVRELTTKTQRTESRVLTHSATETKYYIDSVEQAVTPPLPDDTTTLKLTNTPVIGYEDTIDEINYFAQHAHIIEI